MILRPRLYILQGHEPLAVDAVFEWARAFETNRIVAQAFLPGEVVVSTIFLGIDYGLTGRPPLLFETMVFGGPFAGTVERYSTWAQAEAGHAAMVQRLKDGARP